MAETNRSLHTQISTLRSLHAALDPKSLIVSQFSDPAKPELLQLTTGSSVLERGPRFKEYSDLRDRKLRMKYSKELPTPEKELNEKAKNRTVLITPPKKQVKFNSNLITPPKRPTRHSILAQSVPDFSSALRKENRKPTAMLPAVAEAGSKSANAGEKRRGGWAGRKSYVNVEELKGLGAAAGNAIRGSGYSKTVLGSRQF